MPGRKTDIKPTDSELEILRIIWYRGPSTVRDINDELNEKRDVGYTTTLKLMQIMLEKGLLEREEDGRQHIYRSAIREEETKKLLLDRFVENAFGGSAMQLVMQALGKHKASPEELEELKKLIRKLEQERK
jgi:predicted transcriptional regulator